MRRINLDKGWQLRRGFLDSLGMLQGVEATVVDLPHDSMISGNVDKAAPAGYDWGYYRGDRCNYTKYVYIPAEWRGESIGLRFDGVMMNVIIDINGYKVADHHYGYSPFYVDISRYVTFGEENRITVNCNTGNEPSCRWYPGNGIYRGLELCHGPLVHIANNGINIITRELTPEVAFLEAQIEICNDSRENRLVEVTVELFPGADPVLRQGCASATGAECSEPVARVSRRLQVNPGEAETAYQTIILQKPLLWSAEAPNLYTARVTAVDAGEYRTHLIASRTDPGDECTEPQACCGTVDTEQTCFGVRTITADALRGLLINGRPVKLRGGCVHHDNGLLGAVSLYASEERKIRLLKSAGYNAIRTAHNPPSSALTEACDRLGMYIFDEAFDAWGVAKRIGDYSNYFEYEWDKDLTDFIKRDRIHPSVIMWSTGNEIPERGGLGNGYTLATRLAKRVKELDSTRPVCNGICSYWSGLDDYLSSGRDHTQNAVEDPNTYGWEKRSEPFTNGLDIVGYNYLEEHYENDHRLYPERVIVGTESFPMEIGFRWPQVERLSYVIGDFTWAAWDYLGEAGIGKALYLDRDDPRASYGPWSVMPPATTVYPWRLSNEADFDITGRIMPQGDYRSIVWGSTKTCLYSLHPDNFGKTELMSMWGFPAFLRSWNYNGYENRLVELVAFSSADEVELRINGSVIGRRPVNKERGGYGCQPFVNTVKFTVEYVPGVVEAISYTSGAEVSRAVLQTTGEPVRLVLTPEKQEMAADGHDVMYVGIAVVDEDGRVVPDAEPELTAEYSGAGYLAGFGTGNPITEENYTDNSTTAYRGQAMAVIRSGYEPGTGTVRVTDKKGLSAEIKIIVK